MQRLKEEAIKQQKMLRVNWQRLGKKEEKSNNEISNRTINNKNT